MKNIRWIFGIALIFLLHCPISVSSHGVMENVWLTYSASPYSIKKGPTRVPSQIPIKVGISQEEGNMYISSISDVHVEYYICDSNNNTILSNSLRCFSRVWNYINISLLQKGEYTLYIIAGESCYSGSIIIER